MWHLHVLQHPWTRMTIKHGNWQAYRCLQEKRRTPKWSYSSWIGVPSFPPRPVAFLATGLAHNSQGLIYCQRRHGNELLQIVTLFGFDETHKICLLHFCNFVLDVVLVFINRSYHRLAFTVFGVFPSTWNSLPNSLRDPTVSESQVSTCSGVSWRHTFCEILTRCTQRIKDLARMHLENDYRYTQFTYSHTYLLLG